MINEIVDACHWGWDAVEGSQYPVVSLLVQKQRNRWFNINNPYRYRDDNLRRMGFASYQEYLNSDLWKDIRQRALAREPVGICDKCLKKPSRHVHHRSYDPATLRGDNLLSLNRLCAGCHKRAERPDDYGQSKYDRYKAAGEVMFKRGHPRLRQILKAKRGPK